jgi:hypothetical protein
MAKPIVPGPRLQGVPGFSDNNDRQDLQDLRDRYAAQLNGYGRDADARAAHIPIEAAMDLALRRKMFPVAPGADATGSAAPTPPQTRPAGTQPAGQRPRSPEVQRGNR